MRIEIGSGLRKLAASSALAFKSHSTFQVFHLLHFSIETSTDLFLIYMPVAFLMCPPVSLYDPLQGFPRDELPFNGDEQDDGTPVERNEEEQVDNGSNTADNNGDGNPFNHEHTFFHWYSEIIAPMSSAEYKEFLEWHSTPELMRKTLRELYLKRDHANEVLEKHNIMAKSHLSNLEHIRKEIPKAVKGCFLDLISGDPRLSSALEEISEEYVHDDIIQAVNNYSIG